MATQKAPIARVEVGALVVRTQPDEVVYPLRRDEFDALLEVEAFAEEKRWHDIALASSIAFFTGLLGALVATDWSQVWVGRRWASAVFVGILGLATVIWAVVLVVQYRRIQRVQDHSAFSRVRARIRTFFRHSGCGGHRNDEP